MQSGPGDSVTYLIEQGWNRGHGDILDQVICPDCAQYSITSGLIEHNGIAAQKRYLDSMRSAFPDYQVRVEEMISTKDRVVCRFVMSGTQRGPFMGIPPTNKRATWGAIGIFGFDNGKIQEIRLATDTYSALQQLGAIGLARATGT